MSKKSNKTVSEIVENYRNKYPQLERPVLRSLILAKNNEINPRTLDRHLRKAFSGFKVGKEEPKVITQPESVFQTTWKEHALQELSRVRDLVASTRDDDLIRAPEATLLCLKTVFPQKFRQKMKPEIAKLKKLIEFADEKTTSNPLLYTRRRRIHLIAISMEALPQIIERAYTLIHEN